MFFDEDMPDEIKEFICAELDLVTLTRMQTLNKDAFRVINLFNKKENWKFNSLLNCLENLSKTQLLKGLERCEAGDWKLTDKEQVNLVNKNGLFEDLPYYQKNPKQLLTLQFISLLVELWKPFLKSLLEDPVQFFHDAELMEEVIFQYAAQLESELYQTKDLLLSKLTVRKEAHWKVVHMKEAIDEQRSAGHYLHIRYEKLSLEQCNRLVDILNHYGKHFSCVNTKFSAPEEPLVYLRVDMVCKHIIRQITNLTKLVDLKAIAADAREEQSSEFNVSDVMQCEETNGVRLD